MNRFEAIIKAPQGASEPWNKAIYETASFVAVPSLGSLVAGWMLIIPRRPTLNLRNLTFHERDELNILASQMSGDLSSAFGGEVFAFEHGSTNLGSTVGCGVDQAHLHLVPLKFDLLEISQNFPDGGIQWTDVNVASTYFDTIPSDGEYVSIWRPAKKIGLSGVMGEPQSQWVRRVIASKLGKEEAWDYKEHPHLDVLRETVAIIRKRKMLNPQSS